MKYDSVWYFLQDGDPHYEHKHNVTAKGFGGGSSAPTQPAQPPGENIFEMHSPKQLSRYQKSRLENWSRKQ